MFERAVMFIFALQLCQIRYSYTNILAEDLDNLPSARKKLLVKRKRTTGTPVFSDDYMLGD